MRIFIALDIDDVIRERLRRFVEGVTGFASEARWVRPESMHVTLKFIGEKPAEAVEEIKQAVSAVAGEAIEVAFRGYGFFPTARSARVFWVGIQAGPELANLASAIDQATAALGVPKEDHPYSPHLTLARGGGSGAPERRDRGFQKLQEKLAALPSPEFGTMTAREFFLYQSQPMRGGARYTKIAHFGLD
ncbi:MAG: RNA 2',3'-cyclic phosphodiesterase [Terriglobales bacterium]